MKDGCRQWCGGSCTNCKSKAGILGILHVEGEHTFRTVIGRALLTMRVAARRAKLIMRRAFPFSSCTEEIHTFATQHGFCDIPENLFLSKATASLPYARHRSCTDPDVHLDGTEAH